MKKLSKSYIKKEWQKILYTYKLNEEIRYAQKRLEKYPSQSVAEHITNMLFLAHYFRDLEDPEHKLDFEKVTKIILMHDMGEIEVGDLPTHRRSALHDRSEALAVKKVIKKSPAFISREINILFTEFENMSTPEGRFARAIDKLEGGLYFIINQKAVEMMRSLHTTVDTMLDNHKKRLDVFEKAGTLIIKQYYDVLHEITVEMGAYRPVKLKTKR